MPKGTVEALLSMVARAKTRRRVALHDNAPSVQSLSSQILRRATSPTAKAIYVTVGAAGLAALAIAVFGPKRFEREIVRPVRNVVTDRAERLWDESRSLRDQIGRLFEKAGSETGREKLARSFQSWIGHFRAT